MVFQTCESRPGINVTARTRRFQLIGVKMPEQAHHARFIADLVKTEVIVEPR